MKRFRIDFSIREADCAEGEEPLGIRFGDDVDVKDIFEFFNKCRDAAVILFNGVRPKPGHDPLSDAEIQRLKNEASQREAERLRKMTGMQPAAPRPEGPWEARRKAYGMLEETPIRYPNMDDGSRGGDGPPSKEYLDAFKALNDPDRGRY